MSKERENTWVDHLSRNDPPFPDDSTGDHAQIVDNEWEDFERLVRKFRERQGSLNQSMENIHLPIQKSSKKHRRARAQTFYPCPPPTLSELERDDSDDEDPDPFGYIDTVVRDSFLKIYNW